MKKLIKKVISFFSNLAKKWRAETPLIWKRTRNIAGVITVLIPVIAGVSDTVPSLTVPSWFTEYAWYAMAICVSITAYAGTREKKDKDETN